MLLNLCYVLRSKVHSSYCYYVFIFTAILKQQQAVYRVQTQVEMATRREGLHLWPSVSILCRTLCVLLIDSTPFWWGNALGIDYKPKLLYTCKQGRMM